MAIFGKACVAYTSDFAQLKIQDSLKSQGIVIAWLCRFKIFTRDDKWTGW